MEYMFISPSLVQNFIFKEFFLQQDSSTETQKISTIKDTVKQQQKRKMLRDYYYIH